MRGPVTDAIDANDTTDELRAYAELRLPLCREGSKRQLEHPPRA